MQLDLKFWLTVAALLFGVISALPQLRVFCEWTAEKIGGPIARHMLRSTARRARENEKALENPIFAIYFAVRLLGHTVLTLISLGGLFLAARFLVPSEFLNKPALQFSIAEWVRAILFILLASLLSGHAGSQAGRFITLTWAMEEKSDWEDE